MNGRGYNSFMGKNVKSFLAGIILLIGFAGFSGYGYFVQGQHFAVWWPLVVGVVLAGIDWMVRKPGRAPNPAVMSIAYVVGALAGPAVHRIWGSEVQLLLAVYISSLCVPLVVYLLVATLVVAHNHSGYWSR
jgi:hypothetical protein